jgi:hypothetical protein
VKFTRKFDDRYNTRNCYNNVFEKGLNDIIVIDVGVFTFGWNEYGQLGLGKLPENSTTTVTTPSLVQALQSKSVTQIVSVTILNYYLHFYIVCQACGGFHSICVTSDGECYILGNILGDVNANQNPVFGEPYLVMAPSLNGKFVKFVAAGWWHTIAVTVKRMCKRTVAFVVRLAVVKTRFLTEEETATPVPSPPSPEVRFISIKRCAQDVPDPYSRLRPDRVLSLTDPLPLLLPTFMHKYVLHNF